MSTPALAQVTEVARTPIDESARITFGYLCDDRFVVRNDGDKVANLEYAVEKGNEHTKLQLNAHELVELNSKSRNAMELWMDGKLVAKATKERRSCKNVQGNGAVSVTPLEVNERSQSNNYYGYGSAFDSPFGYYDPFGLRFYSRYGAFGAFSYYPTIVRVPVVIGNRGGRRGH